MAIAGCSSNSKTEWIASNLEIVNGDLNLDYCEDMDDSISNEMTPYFKDRNQMSNHKFKYFGI